MPVLSHDPALNPDLTRGPDGKWLDAPGPLIRSLSVGELAGYDVGRIRPGSREAADFPEQQSADGARIPTLAEALAAEARLFFNLELKIFPDQPDLTQSPAAMLDAVLETIDQFGASGRVSIQSFDWRGPCRVRRLRPDIAVGWLTDAETVAASHLWWDGITPADHGGSVVRAIRAAGGSGSPHHWAPEYRSVTKDQVETAHAQGLRVLPWTVNHTSDMWHMLDIGADGMITDRPDLLIQFLIGVGRWRPGPARATHDVGQRAASL